jgi:hypothetical protein
VDEAGIDNSLWVLCGADREQRRSNRIYPSLVDILLFRMTLGRKTVTVMGKGTYVKGSPSTWKGLV